MKKLLPLLVIALALVACNKEATYKKALDGTWEAYKYVFRNADRTTQFKSDYPGYSITFTEAGTFSESYVSGPDSVRADGTYAFSGNTTKITLTSTGYKLVDTTLVPYDVKRVYSIFNLTASHVQLRNDSSELYLRKLEQ